LNCSRLSSCSFPGISFMLTSFFTIIPCNQDFLKSVSLARKLVFWTSEILITWIYIYQTLVFLMCCNLHS
jgi:hypothetical protein